MDYALETPEELVSDPRSYAFSDFYFDDGVFVGQRDEIVGVAEGAFIGEVGQGSFVSCTRFFNPEGIDAKKPGSQISGRIGKIIGSALRSGVLHDGRTL